MDVMKDVMWDRVLPLVIARAGHSVLHPLEWGALELLVLGGLTQVGLEVYRSGVPYAFDSWDKLPARGKPLETLATRDRQFIGASQVAIVVMTFHYLQFMATSANVLWSLEQVCAGYSGLSPAVRAVCGLLAKPRIPRHYASRTTPCPV